MASTKQTKHNTPLLTRRAALTTPPGIFFRPAYLPTCLVLLFLAQLIFCPFSAAQLDSSFFISWKKVVSPSLEWAVFRGPDKQLPDGTSVTQMRLCLTEDGEQTWRDITPGSLPAHWIETIFFLDRNHGWMFLSDSLSEDPDARFYLLSTADGGKHWQTQEFRRQPYELIEDMFPTGIFFADILHGWILWHWHMMNSDRDSLLRTVDGGKTWTRLPDPPGGGPMNFVSDRDGWLICASGDQEGVPVIEDDALCVSRDAGNNWKRIALQIPNRVPGQRLSFTQIEFQSNREGVVRGQVSNSMDGTESTELQFRTRNGGRTWHCLVVQK